MKNSFFLTSVMTTIFSRNTVGTCFDFDQIFLNDLYTHEPLRRTLLRPNHSSYTFL